jgi:hypothetical protein
MTLPLRVDHLFAANPIAGPACRSAGPVTADTWQGQKTIEQPIDLNKKKKVNYKQLLKESEFSSQGSAQKKRQIF